MARSAILSVRIVGDAKNAVMSMKQTSAAVAGLQRAAASARGVTGSIISSVTKLSLMSSVFGTLAAAALSSVGSILSLGGALASILPVGLALPGLLAGVGVAGGVLIAALKDAGDYLGDLAPQFSALQDSISGAFWERAAAPIREMIGTLLPALEGGLSNVATELGGWAVAFSGALTSATGLSSIQGIVNYTAQALDIAGDGVGMFTEGLLLLANVGSRYLPELASGFNTIADSFLTWITEAEESGDIFVWIDTGLKGLSQLGSAIFSLGGIFAGLTRAATEAGGVGLAGLASGLEAINRVVNGPAFQGALVSVFSGANQAMKELGPGLSSVGAAFIALAPTIAAILPLATSGLGAIIDGVGNLLAHPAVSGGLMTAFEGISTGLTALGGSFESLAPLVGGALTLFGGLASGVLPLLAQAIQVIAPPIGAIVTAIGSWVAANPGLAATLLAVVGGLGALVPVITGVIGFVGTLTATWAAVTTALTPAMTAFGGIVAIFDLLGISLSSVLLPIAGMAAGVALLAGAFVYALSTSEPFRAALGELFTSLGNLVSPIIDAIIPALQQMGASFMSLLGTVMEAVTPMLTSIVTFAAALIAALQPVTDFIGSILAPVFTFLADTVSAAFDWIGSVISAACSFITSIFTTFTALLKGDWSGAWEGIKSIVSTAFDLVKSIIGGGIDFVKSVVSSGLEAVSSIFSTVWETIKGLVSAGWETIKSLFSTGLEAIKSAVSTGLDGVIGFFRELPGKVISAVGDFVGRMTSLGGDIIDGLINGIKGAAGRVGSVISDLIGGIPDVAKKLLGIASPSKVFKSIGRYTSQGLALGIDSMAPKAIGSVSRMAKKIVSAGSGIDLGLAPFSGSLPPISAATPGPAPAAATASAPVQNSITINLNGFTDPIQAAKEIKRVLQFSDTMVGYGN